MKAYYYENNGYNGILLANGERFISYDEIIDGIDVNRENIGRIRQNFIDAEFDENDFGTLYAQECGTLIYGENASECLAEQDYIEEIYSK